MQLFAEVTTGLPDHRLDHRDGSLIAVSHGGTGVSPAPSMWQTDIAMRYGHARYELNIIGWRAGT
jgi:hypothetical protein